MSAASGGSRPRSATPSAGARRRPARAAPSQGSQPGGAPHARRARPARGAGSGHDVQHEIGRRAAAAASPRRAAESGAATAARGGAADARDGWRCGPARPRAGSRPGRRRRRAHLDLGAELGGQRQRRARRSRRRRRPRPLDMQGDPGRAQRVGEALGVRAPRPRRRRRGRPGRARVPRPARGRATRGAAHPVAHVGVDMRRRRGAARSRAGRRGCPRGRSRPARGVAMSAR